MTLARRLALVLIALVPASVAVAQPKSALVKDVDQPARSMYQEEVRDQGCAGTPSCKLTFAAVPAGKRLVVQWVNVFYAMSSSSADSLVALDSILGVQQTFPAFRLQPGPNAATTFTRTINTGVLLYVEAGLSPHIEVFVDANFTGRVIAALSGYYVSVP